MSKKSDSIGSGAERISATEASRSFSDLLDRVEAGHSFLVHRHGRDVCAMTAPRVEGRRASDCLELLRGRSPVLLDEGFGSDLTAIISDEPVEERPSWDS